MVKIVVAKLHRANKSLQHFSLNPLIKHFAHVLSLPKRKGKKALKYIRLTPQPCEANSNNCFKLTLTLT